MKIELAAAQVRYNNQLKKKQEKNRDKVHEETFANGSSSGLGKGISQDVLMMVKNVFIIWEKNFCCIDLFLEYSLSICAQKQCLSNLFP